jgi:hypothetical protein
MSAISVVVGGKPDIETEPKHELKNIAQPVRVYRLQQSGGRGMEPPAARATQ